MSFLVLFRLFLEVFLFDLDQSIFHEICEVVQILKNKRLFFLSKNIFDKLLEWGKWPFSNISNANQHRCE
ncbi:hypothetical protein D0609_23790 [Salmonella enterica]|uniref:Uncharacterized protein n=1 Tax=Salmonella enterica TaxID=28901 RepID=A0A2A6D4N5_SALER|nr:hypothetical protein LM70_24830 [Salmonella enterica subsp. enterica serovar Give]EAA9273561.1 hypothetical protein [Salmonella enterica subsp. enterica]EAM8516531.1 hypothetical protein [Salmonella enterica]ETC69538.1 hypothetical protein SEEE3402_11225 [Salmonella enterica subsp. enterica serovar Enteritidis str. 3402]EAO9977292.1 hypothetical protein [Salmonella enterica]